MRLSILLPVFCLVLAATAAFAQTAPAVPAGLAAPAADEAPPMLMVHRAERSHPEHILMVFKRMAGQEPDFNAWAKTSPYLASAAAVDRDAIISREDNRLRRAWTSLDASQPIVIHVPITLNGYSELQEKLYIPEFNSKAFFSYPIYGESIAVVPKDLARYGAIAMSKKQKDDIARDISGTTLTAELILLPRQVDTKTPFTQGQKNYWLMLADIGEVRFWSGNAADPKLVWMQRDPSYKPRDNATLLDLKPAGQ